jgi:hypothetical protein
MHYLAGTMDYKIHYSGYPEVLEGYNDANWIYDIDELYVTSGYVFTIGSAAVSWRSCKQTILIRYTMDAELVALDTTTVEADWLHELLTDLPIIKKPLPAILVNSDSQSRQFKGQYEVIKRHLKSIKKMRNSKVIALDYIHTEKNLTDPFTKELSRNMIEAAFKEMGLRPI